MKRSLSQNITLLVIIAASFMAFSSAGATALVSEKSNPDACANSKADIAKCNRWYSLSLKNSPDACAAVKSTLGKCGDWYVAEAPEAPAPKAPKIIVLKGVNFETGSARITAASLPVLQKNVSELQGTRAHVDIVGYTDSRGSDAYNQKLSESRANSVKDYFVQNGIDASHLSAEGKGEADPIGSNDTEEGRFQNRRIELHLK